MEPLRSTRRAWKRWAALGALAAAILFLPATTPAEAHSDRHYRGQGHGHGHGHGHPVRVSPRYGPVYAPVYAPVRVVYRRPHTPPSYYYLPTAYVTVHGPSVAASVVLYPRSAPVVYEPGYCPATVHYHPYVPGAAPVYGRSGVRGSVNLRLRF